MGVLKWIGYIVAATVVLSIALGIAAAVVAGAALVCLIGLVLFIAALIRSLVSS